MPIVKSYTVGSGDMFYIRHGSDNFTIIDCDLNGDNADAIIADLKAASSGKSIRRFISTHPDEDHFGGIELLDDTMPINNFYVVANAATKGKGTTSFERYCALRDGSKAFNIYKGCSRRWMSKEGDGRGSSGISVLWPDRANAEFKVALADAAKGGSPNDMSAVIRYKLAGGCSVLWLGDLGTGFMEAITDHISLPKTTIVFAAHHGRASGKIPDAWLERLQPQLIVIGEAPARDLHYYTGYETITQNRAGDITMELVGDRVHFYVTGEGCVAPNCLVDEGASTYDGYIGTLVVEK